jgi:hypothetical protein
VVEKGSLVLRAIHTEVVVSRAMQLRFALDTVRNRLLGTTSTVSQFRGPAVTKDRGAVRRKRRSAAFLPAGFAFNDLDTNFNNIIIDNRHRHGGQTMPRMA